jgi:hypothetical protein
MSESLPLQLAIAFVTARQIITWRLVHTTDPFIFFRCNTLITIGNLDVYENMQLNATKAVQSLQVYACSMYLVGQMTMSLPSVFLWLVIP